MASNTLTPEVLWIPESENTATKESLNRSMLWNWTDFFPLPNCQTPDPGVCGDICKKGSATVVRSINSASPSRGATTPLEGNRPSTSKRVNKLGTTRNVFAAFVPAKATSSIEGSN